MRLTAYALRLPLERVGRRPTTKFNFLPAVDLGSVPVAV
jgi:hypothetical protein